MLENIGQTRLVLTILQALEACQAFQVTTQYIGNGQYRGIVSLLVSLEDDFLRDYMIHIEARVSRSTYSSKFCIITKMNAVLYIRK